MTNNRPRGSKRGRRPGRAGRVRPGTRNALSVPPGKTIPEIDYEDIVFKYGANSPEATEARMILENGGAPGMMRLPEMRDEFVVPPGKRIAMQMEDRYGPESPEAQIAWEIAEEMDAEENSAMYRRAMTNDMPRGRGQGNKRGRRLPGMRNAGATQDLEVMLQMRDVEWHSAYREALTIAKVAGKFAKMDGFDVSSLIREIRVPREISSNSDDWDVDDRSF